MLPVSLGGNKMNSQPQTQPRALGSLVETTIQWHRPSRLQASHLIPKGASRTESLPLGNNPHGGLVPFGGVTLVVPGAVSSLGKVSASNLNIGKADSSALDPAASSVMDSRCFLELQTS